jgi:peptide chain release factor 1
MLEKLEKIEQRFQALAEQMANPQVTSDHSKYTKLAREYSEMEGVVKKFQKYKKVITQIEDSRSILQSSDDEEMKQLAEEELAVLTEEEEELEKQLQMLLVPPDPHDASNAILEIRAGTGGDEAGIFAGDLYRMYAKYCEREGWKMELMGDNPSERGGFKEIIVSIIGKGAYGKFKFESGVHRVQRVPETETQGRIHTSAASVVVLPEIEDLEEIDLNPNDLRIDVFRASGHGGQHVNTTDSAVRIVHLPTGITASCQDEKSQLKNKNKAMKVLKARLYDFEMSKRQDAITSQRRSMIRSGDRSEKIRTYNYPQSRVTDHRINLTLYRLEEILEGDLDELINEVKIADQAEQLKESELQQVNG